LAGIVATVEHPFGKIFAAAYLIALPALLAGAIVAVVDALVGVWIVVPSVVVLVILANVLARRLPTGRKPGLKGLSGYQIQWYRLLFGAEVRRASSVLWTARNSSPPAP
jgi:hypothetical protein